MVYIMKPNSIAEAQRTIFSGESIPSNTQQVQKKKRAFSQISHDSPSSPRIEGAKQTDIRVHGTGKVARITSTYDQNSFLSEIEHRLRDHLKGIKNIRLSYEDIKSSFKDSSLAISCVKTPKWEDDAIIVRIQDPSDKTKDVSVKIHEDKYPLASHIYDNKTLLKSVSESGHAAKVSNSFSQPGEKYQYRAVIYDYLQGKPMGSLAKNADDATLMKLRSALKNCVSGLLQSGVNVFVRDLDDFIVVQDKGSLKAILTDYNAAMDCSGANLYSRTKITDIIFHVIDKVVSSNYKPFVSTRPTLTDLKGSAEKKDNDELDLRF